MSRPQPWVFASRGACGPRALARSQGTAVVVISHDVDTIMALADRIVVLRSGEVILEGTPMTITEESLVHAMAGYVRK